MLATESTVFAKHILRNRIRGEDLQLGNRGGKLNHISANDGLVVRDVYKRVCLPLSVLTDVSE